MAQTRHLGPVADRIQRAQAGKACIRLFDQAQDQGLRRFRADIADQIGQAVGINHLRKRRRARAARATGLCRGRSARRPVGSTVLGGGISRQRPQQGIAPDGLGQRGLHPCRAKTRLFLRQGMGCQRQDPRLRRRPAAHADRAGGGDAIHPRHGDIHQDRVEPRLSGLLHAFDTIRGLGHLMAAAFQEAPQQEAVDRIVLDQQHPQGRAWIDIVAGIGLAYAQGGRLCRRRGRGGRQGQAQPEQASLALQAFQPDLAPHGAGEPSRDAKAKPGATGAAPIAGIQRDEILKDPLLIRLGDADAGIAHANLHQPGLIRQAFRLDRDMAVAGELHRIADKVQKDLPKLAPVADHPAQRAVRLRYGHAVPRRLGQARLIGGGLFQQAVQVEGGGLGPGGPDFGARHVKDGIHMAQQDLARGFHHRQKGALVVIGGGAAQEFHRPDQPVQRGAHLMAHHRQEFRLGLLARLRPVKRKGQRGLGLPAGRDVAQEGHHDARILPRGPRDGDFGRKDAAIGAAGIHLDAQGILPLAPRFGQGRDQRALLGAIHAFGKKILQRVPPDGAGGGQAEDRLGGGIEVKDDAIAIGDHDPVRRCGDDGRQARAGIRQDALLDLRPAELQRQDGRNPGQDQHQRRRHRREAQQRQRNGFAVQIGLGREIGYRIQRHRPGRGPHFGQGGGDPPEVARQHPVGPVDQRDRLVQIGHDLAIACGIVRQIHQRRVKRAAVQHGHAAVEDVEPAAHLVQPVGGGALLRLGQRALQAQHFHFGLQHHPLGIVGIGPFQHRQPRPHLLGKKGDGDKAQPGHQRRSAQPVLPHPQPGCHLPHPQLPAQPRNRPGALSQPMADWACLPRRFTMTP